MPKNHRLTSPEVWLGALVFATGIMAAAHTQAADWNGYCGNSTCEILNNPLVECDTENNTCQWNPGGSYYIYCCPIS